MNPCSARGAWTNRANVGFGNNIMTGDLSEKLRSRTERAADASVGFSIRSSFSRGKRYYPTLEDIAATSCRDQARKPEQAARRATGQRKSRFGA